MFFLYNFLVGHNNIGTCGEIGGCQIGGCQVDVQKKKKKKRKKSDQTTSHNDAAKYFFGPPLPTIVKKHLTHQAIWSPSTTS